MNLTLTGYNDEKRSRRKHLLNKFQREDSRKRKGEIVKWQQLLRETKERKLWKAHAMTHIFFLFDNLFAKQKRNKSRTDKSQLIETDIHRI